METMQLPQIIHQQFLTAIHVGSSARSFAATEAVVQRCSVKKVFLEISQNSQENTCARVSFLIKLQAFIKKETLAQVFSSEFCEISENTFGGCFYY